MPRRSLERVKAQKWIVYYSLRRLRADSLGHLVRVVAVLLLERLDEGDVLLLGGSGGGACVDLLLPGALLGLAL